MDQQIPHCQLPVTTVPHLEAWQIPDDGASQSSFPSSTSRPSASAVNALVFEAMPNRVRASTALALPSRRTHSPGPAPPVHPSRFATACPAPRTAASPGRRSGRIRVEEQGAGSAPQGPQAAGRIRHNPTRNARKDQTSSSAATPGNSLPSRNSSEAPPPVEMWVILSSSPAWVTAAAESPPPTTVMAPLSVARPWRAPRERAVIECCVSRLPSARSNHGGRRFDASAKSCQRPSIRTCPTPRRNLVPGTFRSRAALSLLCMHAIPWVAQLAASLVH